MESMYSQLLDGTGCWLEVYNNIPIKRLTPALFLDRDGIIVEDVHYLKNESDVNIIPGISKLILECNAINIPVIVVTNQSGIARKFFTWKEFLNIEKAINLKLANYGAKIDMVLECGFHKEGLEPYYHPAHPWRKPSPGMIKKATEIWPVDLGRSWLLGDKMSDLLAARSAGISNSVLVRKNISESSLKKIEVISSKKFKVFACKSVKECEFIIEYFK